VEKPEPETFQIEGEVLTEEAFAALSEVTEDDIRAAINDFNVITPKPFKGMIGNPNDVKKLQ
jgi:hypothetical protein